MKILDHEICKFGVKFITDEGNFVWGVTRIAGKKKKAWASEDGRLLLDPVKESKLRWAKRKYDEKIENKVVSD